MDVFNLKFLKISVWRSQAYLWTIDCLSFCLSYFPLFQHSEHFKRIKDSEFLNAVHLGSPVCVLLHFPLSHECVCMYVCVYVCIQVHTYKLRLNHLKISCRHHDTSLEESPKMWLLRMRTFLYRNHITSIMSKKFTILCNTLFYVYFILHFLSLSPEVPLCLPVVFFI